MRMGVLRMGPFENGPSRAVQGIGVRVDGSREVGSIEGGARVKSVGLFDFRIRARFDSYSSYTKRRRSTRKTDTPCVQSRRARDGVVSA